MNDLLSQMMSDSGQTKDQLDKLDDNKLDAVSRLAAEASVMESSIKSLEEQLT